MATGLDVSNILFKGVDGSECETFIASIEELAFSEGWSEDRHRMLLFARSRLRNTALRWFAKLDVSIKGDWDLFVQALFDQYPPVVSHRDEVAEVPTPLWSATRFNPACSRTTLPAVRFEESVAGETEQQKGTQVQFPECSMNTKATKSSDTLYSEPLPRFETSRLDIHVGRLRVVCEEKTHPSWIWRGTTPVGIFSKEVRERYGRSTFQGRGIKSITHDRSNALLVWFRSGAEPHLITCPDTDQTQRSLAIYTILSSPGFFPLTASNAVTKVIEQARYCNSDGDYWTPSDGLVSNIWNVLDDGTLQATLSDFSQPPRDGMVKASICTTTTVYVDIAGLAILFAKDDAAPQVINPDTGRPVIKARIVFEPL